MIHSNVLHRAAVWLHETVRETVCPGRHNTRESRCCWRGTGFDLFAFHFLSLTVQQFILRFFFCFRFLSFSYYWIIKGITVHLVDCSTLPKVVDKLFDVEVSKFGPAARNGIKCNKIISINATRSGWFVWFFSAKAGRSGEGRDGVVEGSTKSVMIIFQFRTSPYSPWYQTLGLRWKTSLGCWLL